MDARQMQSRQMPEVRSAEVTHEPGAEIDPPRLDRRILTTVIVTAVASWAAIEWLTPAPVHPEREIDALSMLVNGAFFGLTFAGACFLVDRRAALGYGCIAGAAWVQFAGVVACPATAHHDYGAWWAGQMAVCLAFAVVSTMAATISLRTSGPVHRSPR